MNNIFWIIRDPHGQYMLDTLASGRNFSTHKVMGDNPSRRHWQRLYNDGYRVIKFELVEK